MSTSHRGSWGLKKKMLRWLQGGGVDATWERNVLGKWNSEILLLGQKSELLLFFQTLMWLRSARKVIFIHTGHQVDSKYINNFFQWRKSYTIFLKITFINLFSVYISVCVCHDIVCGSHRTTCRSYLPLPCGCWDWTQVMRLGGKSLYLLTHIISPYIGFEIFWGPLAWVQISWDLQFFFLFFPPNTITLLCL